MPVDLPHAHPTVTRQLRENLETLRQAEHNHELEGPELQQAVAQQLDEFRTNKQAPRGCMGRRKYVGMSATDLAAQKLGGDRAARGAGLVGWVQAQALRGSPPDLSRVFEQVQREQRFTGRELEARLLNPAGLLAGYIGGPDEAVTCRQAYARLKDARWASSCGQTSDLLKELISDDWVAGPASGSKPGMEILDDLKAAIRNPANTHIRVQIGCHSFMIENSGPNCRLYQSYMAVGFGGYGLADSLQTDRAMPRAEFLQRLEQVFDPRTNDHAAATLFRGTCDPTANADPGDVKISFETTSQPRSAAQLKRAFEAKLGENRAAWREVAGSNQRATEYALAHLA